MANDDKLVKYTPTQPVGTRATLRAIVDQQKESFFELMPKHVTKERLLKTLSLAVNINPQLLECTQGSVMNGIARSAELGLDLSITTGEAYLVPFNNNIAPRGQPKRFVMQATFIPGYRGLAKLARQSGMITRIESEVIHEIDLVPRGDGEPGFILQKGTDFRLKYLQYIGNEKKGEPVGAYCLAEFKDGGYQAEFMSVDEIEAVRQQAKSKNSPAWTVHWPQMARKTVFRRLAKWLPLSNERYLLALEADNADYESDDSPPIIDLTAGDSKTEKLTARLEEKREKKGPNGEPWATLSDDAVREIRGRLEKSEISESDLCRQLGHDTLSLEQLPKETFTEALSILGG